MNLLAGIILLSLLAEWGLHRLADLLDLKHQPFQPPREFADITDPLTYQKSRDYLTANTRFAIITSTYDLILVLIFWFGGGFQAVDGAVRSLGWGPLATGLVYIGSLIILRGLVRLPAHLYHTFVIEEKFGFNRTTWKTFIADIVKATLVAGLIGTPLIAAVLAIFLHGGPQAWLACWAVMALCLIVLQYIAPTLILPLFNKFDPLSDGELRDAILSYADRNRFPLENVYVMDGSRRSSKSNAFFTGFGRKKRIVLFDTLIERFGPDELVSILAHEIGHFKKRHLLKMLLVQMALLGLKFYLLSVFISYPGLFEAFYVQNISIHAGLIFFALLYTPFDFFFGIILNRYLRRNEYEADRFSVRSTGNRRGLITALKKLAADNLSSLTPHPLRTFLTATHPPVIDRITALRQNAR